MSLCPIRLDGLTATCEECGWSLVLTEPVRVVRRSCSRRLASEQPERCPHLGPQIKRKSDNAPLTVEVTCDTCGGKRKQVAQALHHCALYRRCLPTYRPSAEQRAEYESRPDAVRLCDGCPRA